MTSEFEYSRDFKGIWIKSEIWTDERLSIVEKALIAEIDSLSNMDAGCFASDQYFADFLKVSKSSIVRSIKHLKELGLIYVESFDGRTRTLRSCTVNSTVQDGQIDCAGQPKRPSINIYNNTSIKKNTKKDSGSDEPECDPEPKEKPVDHREDLRLIAKTYKESGKTACVSAKALKSYIGWIKGKNIAGVKVKLTREEIYDGVRRYIYEQMKAGKDDMQYWKSFETLINQIDKYVEMNREDE